jgi:transcriptional regulator with XRE-family HTH domain
MKDFDFKREIGKEIRRIRKGLDLNQEEFGELIKIHKDQISRYERGVTQPRPELLNKIFEYSDTIPDFFKISEPPTIYEVFTTEQKKLLDNVREILESSNEYAIDALKSNIRAFLEMVRISKKNDEDKSKGGV